MTTESAEALLERVNGFQRREIWHRYVVMTALIVGWSAVLVIEAMIVYRLDASRKQLRYDNSVLLKSRDALTNTNNQMMREIGLKQAELLRLDDNVKSMSLLLEHRRGASPSTQELIASYDWALLTDKNNAVLYNLKGYALFREGAFIPAIDNLKQATVLSPAYVWGHYNLALALWANGDHNAAIVEVKRVVRIDPSFVSIILADGQFKPFHTDEAFNEALDVPAPPAQVYLTSTLATKPEDVGGISKLLSANDFSIVTATKVPVGVLAEGDEVIYYSSAVGAEATKLATLVKSITHHDVRTRFSPSSSESLRRYDLHVDLSRP
jgi:tetratricopeptide (TPR) repeat protein